MFHSQETVSYFQKFIYRKKMTEISGKFQGNQRRGVCNCRSFVHRNLCVFSLFITLFAIFILLLYYRKIITAWLSSFFII